jgi:hypothetical protein
LFTGRITLSDTHFSWKQVVFAKSETLSDKIHTGFRPYLTTKGEDSYQRFTGIRSSLSFFRVDELATGYIKIV